MVIEDVRMTEISNNAMTQFGTFASVSNEKVSVLTSMEFQRNSEAESGSVIIA